MAILDRHKHEPKKAKERDEQIAKSKLLPKSTDPFRFIRDYAYVIVIHQSGAVLPLSFYRFSKVPNENCRSDTPNLKSNMTNPTFVLPHQIFNQNSEFYSEVSAYHPSKNTWAQSPLHIVRHIRDPNKMSAPDRMPLDKPQTQTPSNAPIRSTSSNRHLPTHLTLPLPYHHPNLLSFWILLYHIRRKYTTTPFWSHISSFTTQRHFRLNTPAR